jgi:putative glycosyltransferase (TIGR04372 family)
MSSKITVQQLLDEFNIAANNADAPSMLNIAQQLLERDPNNADFMLFVLQALEAAGQLTANLAFIQKYILARSTNVSGFMLLYKTYMKQKKILEALLALTYALSVEPDNVECQRLLLVLLSDIRPGLTHVRLNIMTTNRVGHLACEIEPWARATDDHEKDCLYIFVSSSSVVPANTYLYQLLHQVAHIVESDFFYQLYASRPLLLSDDSYAEYPYDLFSSLRGISNLEIVKKGNAKLTEIYRDYAPCLTISADDKKLGWEHLEAFDITTNDKLVCFHVRDSAYLNSKFSDRDWSHHDYRDADITTYKESIEYLIEQGYKVIRIGAETNQKLDLASPDYFDFCISRSSTNGDFIEVFLLSECSFFIGNYGGPYGVAAVFDTPTIVVNAAPAVIPYLKNGHYIPKLLLKNNELVSFIDIANGANISDENSIPIISCLSEKDLSAHYFKYKDNNSTDILRAVSEFEKRISNGIFDGTLTNEQIAFRESVPSDFCAPDSTNLICSSFIEDHLDAFYGIKAIGRS